MQYRGIDELRVKALETFVDRLKEREKDNLLRIVLFGSVARKDSRPYSDIDVFVMMKHGTMMELTERITDISIDIDIEEGDCKTHLSPFIVTESEYKEKKSFGIPIYHIIDKEGVILYDARA